VANIKSQIKRNKTNEKANERNKAFRSALRTQIRKFRTVADAGDAEATQIELRAVSRKLDKAVTKGVLHKNAAANKKSSLAKRAATVSNG